jgi:transposase, IS5 family
MIPRKTQSETEQQGSLFRIELNDLINNRHRLVVLAGQIPWHEFDEAFTPMYCPDNGRPGVPTRLMIGLHYLKHTYGLSDEETVMRWVENPYWQYFCGSKWFEHELPIDPSTMTRWRRMLGEAGMEKLLEGTIEAGLKSGLINETSFQKINVDTTVQEKAVEYPTDAKLYHKMRGKLVRIAHENGVELRQSYKRLGKRALLMVSRYMHARQAKRAGKELKKLRNYLGCVVRDIERKINGDEAKINAFAELLAMAHRLLDQKRSDSNKLYSIHAPETECIAKGKAHKKYEFGVKVGVVTTSRDNFVIGIKALHGNPYDGHTLSTCIDQAERLTGRVLDGEIFVDRGYRKHDYTGPAKVHVVGKGIKDAARALRRWLKRRSAIEPLIGHMKNDGSLGRNYLAGVEGDRVNALLCGCGQNLRKLLHRSSFFGPFYLRCFSLLFRIFPSHCSFPVSFPNKNNQDFNAPNLKTTFSGATN